MKRSVFVLQKHTLLKDHQPFHWDIRIKANFHLEEMNIYEDPETLQPGASTQVRVRKCYDLRWLTFEGKAKVDGLWTQVEIIDKGPVDISPIMDFPMGFLFNFHGKTFNAVWTLQRMKDVWVLSRTKQRGQPLPSTWSDGGES